MKFLVFIGIIVVGFIYLIVLSGRADDQERREWRDFVAEHHCKIVESKWYKLTVWQCDGFQVEHY